MIKRFLTLALLVVYLAAAISLTSIADDDIPTSLEAPHSLYVIESDNSGYIYLRFKGTPAITEFLKENDLILEVDWKIDNGPWHYNKSWGSFSAQSLIEFYDENQGIAIYINNIGADDDNARSFHVTSGFLNTEAFDMQNNTYFFRVRYVYEYSVSHPQTGEWGYQHVVSPWTETAVGKLVGELPGSIDAPLNLRGEVKKRADNKSYFYFQWELPQSVLDINERVEVICFVDWRIGQGEWASQRTDVIPFSHESLTYNLEADAVNEAGLPLNAPEAVVYQFRAYTEFKKPGGDIVRSPFSNVISIDASDPSNTGGSGENTDSAKICPLHKLLPYAPLGICICIWIIDF